ncbi:hypothetical protein T484DRAFT_3598493 [Baffinella frigidus]|nr:hypothetical protein T484DRAFT_3598493 [Cryptophyta sp. CCMP2293]
MHLRGDPPPPVGCSILTFSPIPASPARTPPSSHLSSGTPPASGGGSGGGFSRSHAGSPPSNKSPALSPILPPPSTGNRGSGGGGERGGERGGGGEGGGGERGEGSGWGWPEARQGGVGGSVSSPSGGDAPRRGSVGAPAMALFTPSPSPPPRPVSSLPKEDRSSSPSPGQSTGGAPGAAGGAGFGRMRSPSGGVGRVGSGGGGWGEGGGGRMSSGSGLSIISALSSFEALSSLDGGRISSLEGGISMEGGVSMRAVSEDSNSTVVLRVVAFQNLASLTLSQHASKSRFSAGNSEGSSRELQGLQCRCRAVAGSPAALQALYGGEALHGMVGTLSRLESGAATRPLEADPALGWEKDIMEVRDAEVLDYEVDSGETIVRGLGRRVPLEGQEVALIISLHGPSDGGREGTCLGRTAVRAMYGSVEEAWVTLQVGFVI